MSEITIKGLTEIANDNWCAHLKCSRCDRKYNESSGYFAFAQCVSGGCLGTGLVGDPAAAEQCPKCQRLGDSNAVVIARKNREAERQVEVECTIRFSVWTDLSSSRGKYLVCYDKQGQSGSIDVDGACTMLREFLDGRITWLRNRKTDTNYDKELRAHHFCPQCGGTQCHYQSHVGRVAIWFKCSNCHAVFGVNITEEGPDSKYDE